MKESLTPLELIDQLNGRYFELAQDGNTIPFSYSTDGYCSVVHLFEWPIWSSEADGWPSEDDGETLTDYVFKLFVEHIQKINAVSPRELFYPTPIEPFKVEA